MTKAMAGYSQFWDTRVTTVVGRGRMWHFVVTIGGVCRWVGRVLSTLIRMKGGYENRPAHIESHL